MTAAVLAVVMVIVSDVAADARPRRRTRIVRVMAIGDSITDGGRVPGGYRISLQQRLKRVARVDFVGSLANGPAEAFDRDHEGHSGFRIDEITANAAVWVGTARPQVVLLMIGTNDLLQYHELTAAPARLLDLLRAIDAASPRVQIVMSKVPPFPDRRAEREQLNQSFDAVAAAGRAAGVRVSVIDAPARMLDTDLEDGIHPTAHGHELLADGFYLAARNAVLAARGR